jgi:hypothetical protein
MGSRQQTDGEAVRLPKLTRRAVIAGTSAATLGGGKVAGAVPPRPDEGAKLCTQWLHLDAKIRRLQDRWRKLEHWLVQNHRWLQLSEAEQQALPWSKELQDIDGCLDVLFEKRDALLESVPAAGSANLGAIITKLAVVERLIWSDDHPEAHALIAGSVQDLIALSHKGPADWNRPRNSGPS